MCNVDEESLEKGNSFTESKKNIPMKNCNHLADIEDQIMGLDNLERKLL